MSVFRQKNIDKVSSPEQLNDYIRVTTPSVWLVLAALVLLLIGMLAWSVLGTVEATDVKGETKENEAGRRRREKTRIRSSAWCPQKPQTSQNFEKPQVKPLINERSLARQL